MLNAIKNGPKKTLGTHQKQHSFDKDEYVTPEVSFVPHFYRDVLLEKHWKSVIHRSICDYFFDAQKKAASPEDVSPVLSTPHHYLISVYHNQVYFLAVTTTEIPPLMVIEFLHRVVHTFSQYFDECSDTSIKENCVMVFELLDEMLDNGYPLVTELNILQDLIKPPNFLRSIANQVTGRTNHSETLPTGQLSNIPWRRQGVKYTNNEAYFDVIEEIDAIIDKQGSTVFAEIQGYIDVCCKLSGMPDLTMTLVNPRLLDDVSFHPCVRFKRWENERVLSFVPPDGNFRLLSYHIATQNMVAIPIYVRHCIVLKGGTGSRIEMTVGPKQSMGKILEDVVVEMSMPKAVLNCNLVPSQGKCTFDPTSHVLQWTIGKIELGKPPNIKGTVSVSGTTTIETPPISLRFRINQLAVSGLKVNRLDMYGEKYKPFKGVKYITKAGKFQSNAVNRNLKMLNSGQLIARRFMQATRPLGIPQRKFDEVLPPEEAGWAFNHIEKKKGLYKPKHTIEEQIAYMKSKGRLSMTLTKDYPYIGGIRGISRCFCLQKKRLKSQIEAFFIFKGQSILQPPPRLFCIDKHGRFNVNNACPICRDEYLFFDFRNPALIEQFLSDGTHHPIDILKSGLCREQYALLKAQLLAAKEHGTITFGVDFRNFDYRDWYKDWKEPPMPPVERAGIRLQDIHPDPLVSFPVFKRDYNNDWDQWWLRHDKFAKKAK
ncbi:adaptor complexe medium subunit family protein [Necator americanus]|uniref:Adaptor complexe medium subunit family protein n=1 Tax=Necator americanus TaxID=51031 RepID=W2TT52_NECAM|nr:adaptor complexe medium subunit family protein [Necator americanus]ETN84963.1 adaptor complexe medium subunit family protein [Necator americanus]